MAVIEQDEQRAAQEAVHTLYSASSLLEALEWLDRMVHRRQAKGYRLNADTTTGAARAGFFLTQNLASRVVGIGVTQGGDVVLSVPEGEALDWWSHLNWYQVRIDWARWWIKLVSHSEVISAEGAQDMRTPSIELIVPLGKQVIDLLDGEDKLLRGRHEVLDQQTRRYRLRYDEADSIPVVDATAGDRQSKIAR